jgi:hypothetical protein
MLLLQDTVTSLNVLIQTATTVGIERMLIGDGLIRGFDERKTVGIVTDKNIPDLDGKLIALNRLKILQSRISLGNAQGALQVDATIAPNGKDISILEIQAGKFKSQFRCASLEAVKGIPKGMSDPLAWEVKIPTKLIPLIAQTEGSMATEGITFASKDGKKVTIELVDSNKDVASFELDDDANFVGTGSETSFCNIYSSKPLLSLLREAGKVGDVVTLTFGAGGLLRVTANGFEFFVLPKV